VLLTLPVREVLTATPRARILRLDLGGTRFPYLPGQAVLVATHGRELRRPYSIAASPEDALRDDCIELLIGVDEGGSPGPHLLLEPRAPIDVEGPLGNFTFPSNPRERRFLFIAGGTGISPLRAMLRHALTIPDAHIGLFYSARTPDEFAYEAELRELSRDGHIELQQTVTREGSSDWTGGRGRIARGHLEPLVHDPATLCFVCGPPTLVEEVPRLLEGLGISRSQIVVEDWGSGSKEGAAVSTAERRPAT
jgi:NAD(P)H-flavin reductase